MAKTLLSARRGLSARAPLAAVLALVIMGFTASGVRALQDPTTEPAHDGGLARRGRIGLLFSEGPAGLLVREVVRNSPAAAAGFRTGDVVTSVDGVSVRDRSTLVSRVRSLRAGDTIRLGLLRDGATAEVAVTSEEVPREGDLDARAEYRAFEGRGARLRSVWSIPARPSSAPRAAMLVVRGVGAPAADAPGNNPFRDLAFHLAHQGMIVVRYDAQGVGDSEGGPPETVDFDTELSDARSALAHLRSDPRVDPERVVVLGEGTGGGVAAVLASTDATLAGLVVLGTIARPLMEYATESRRAQLALAGVGPEETDGYVRDHIAVLSRLVDGGSLAAGAGGIVESDGTLLGKRVEYWRQYDGTGLVRLFAKLTLPVLNAIGEYDFVSCIGEHRAIADALRSKRPDGTVLLVLEGTDHELRAYESREAAYEGFASASAPTSERALGRVAEWIRANVKGPIE